MDALRTVLEDKLHRPLGSCSNEQNIFLAGEMGGVTYHAGPGLIPSVTGSRSSGPAIYTSASHERLPSPRRMTPFARGAARFLLLSLEGDSP